MEMRRIFLKIEDLNLESFFESLLNDIVGFHIFE